MKFDLKDFKKLHSTKSHTVFQHPDGHEIKISHAAISPKHRSELHSMDVKKMDEGGRVSAEGRNPKLPKSPINPPPSPAESLTRSFMNATGSEGIKQAKTNVQNYAEGDLVENPQQPSMPEDNALIPELNSFPQDPTASDVPPGPGVPGILSNMNIGNPNMGGQNASAPQLGLENASIPLPNQNPQGDIYGTEEYLKNLQQGVGLQEKGLKEEAQAAKAAGQAEAQAHKQALDQQQGALNEFHKNVREINNDIGSATEDYKNQHINPNHYFQSLSTWGKISTALGLIVGGLGGGEGASKFLDDQINRDVKAQEAEMGKKENLLSMNFKKFGNMRDAADMTRMQQMDMAAHTLGMARANAQGPAAQALVDQKIGELKMKIAPIASQMAARRALLSNGSVKSNPDVAVRMIIQDPHDKAKAQAELQSAELLGASKNRAMQVFDQLRKVTPIGNRIMNPVQSGKQIEALREPAVLEIARDAAGRVNEYELPGIRAMFPEMGDNNETIAKKQKSLSEFLQKKMQFPVLKSYGITPPGMNSRPVVNPNARGRK